MSEVQRVGLGQPHMAVDAGAFIKPAIAEAGVHADDQIVLAAIIQKVGQVEAEGRVAIVVATHERAVQEHQRVAEGSVELDRHAPSGVFLGNIEDAPVPAHAGLGIAAAQRLVAVPLLFFIANERQLDRPVVRQVQWPPFGVVEFLRSKFELARLGEIALPHAESQIAPRIAAMSRKKLPAKIEQQTLARSHRGQSLRRRCAGIGRKQRMGAAHGACDQRRGGKGKAGRSRSRRVREFIHYLAQQIRLTPTYG